MIRHHENSPLPERPQFFQHRPNDEFVDVLNCLQPSFSSPPDGTCLVGHFDVTENQFVFVQHPGRLAALAGIIRIVKTGHSIDFVNIPSQRHANPRKRSTPVIMHPLPMPNFCLNFGIFGGMSLSPKPNLRGRIATSLPPCPVDFMIHQQNGRFIHDIPKNFASIAFGQISGDRLLGNFVRRPGGDIKLLLATIDQQIAIAYARVKLKPRQFQMV